MLTLGVIVDERSGTSSILSEERFQPATYTIIFVFLGVGRVQAPRSFCPTYIPKNVRIAALERARLLTRAVGAQIAGCG